MTSSQSASALVTVGRLTTAAGTLLLAGGAAAWAVVTQQLGAEKISVPDDADVLPGKPVQGPVTAYAEALVIKRNAERGSAGKTFADISEELKTVEKGSDEERKLRGQSAALSTAASLRTSLMTSVLAYGVSALVAGLGAFFLVTGRVLRRG
ncbi:aromatic ring-opening dioxygenase LigA [Microbacterium sp. GXF7504]